MRRNFVYFVIVFMFLSIFAGCATTSNKFISIYNDAVANGSSVIIVKEGEFEDIKNGVNKNFKSLGYENVLSSSPEQGFMVVAKDVSLAKTMLMGEAYPCRIILKYTNAGKGKTRIDLANGSSDISSQKKVNKDLQDLAALIKSD